MKPMVYDRSTFSSDYLHGHFLPIGVGKPQFCFRVSDKDGIPEKKSYIVQETDELALKQSTKCYLPRPQRPALSLDYSCSPASLQAWVKEFTVRRR